MSGLALTAVVAVTAPAWAALLGMLGRERTTAAAFGVLGAGVALVAAVAETATTWTGARDVVAVPLLGTADTGGTVIELTLRADALAGLVAVAVGLVALCVQVYSAGYLVERGAGHPASAPPQHPAPADVASRTAVATPPLAGSAEQVAEPAPTRYRAYAATVSLFTAAMMLVVHADDLVLLLIGWEVMGLCSYLLIGHHSERQAARSAAAKAFLVTRVGDVGFLLGVVVLVAGAGTSSVSGLLSAVDAGTLDRGTVTVACLLLVAGVVGKSAQVPLHTWLPDAMEGPTPVSALIHAATMVAAGVVVVARLLDLFALAPAALAVLGSLAAVTTVAAAFAALAQDDLKRLLAWSTISQVGLMLGALAVGTTGDADGQGRPAAIAHLLSHAGFKALLFLGAGVVTHLVGSTLLRDMGGLARRAPLVGWTFAAGLAALAGLPPTSGFVSKEAVLGVAEEAALHPGTADGASLLGPVAWVVLVAGLVTTVVTAVYSTRAFCVVVLGRPVHPVGAEHALPRELTGPLVVLAVPTVALGLLPLAGPAALDGFRLGVGTAVLGTVLALAGVALGLLGLRREDRDVAVLLPARARVWLLEGYRADAVQVALVARPLRRLASTVAAGDRDVVDAYVRGAATGAGWAGRGLRYVQGGVVTSYLAWVLGAAALVGLGVVVL
ncbi:NADH-quinone oxidoreductase subunit 5 family protein [Thalassiella azotivora]